MRRDFTYYGQNVILSYIFESEKYEENYIMTKSNVCTSKHIKNIFV